MKIHPRLPLLPFLLLLLSACHKDGGGNSGPGPNPRNIHYYTYAGTTVLDYKVFAGSASGGADITSSYPHIASMWGDKVFVHIADSIRDLDNNTLIEFHQVNNQKDTFPYQVSHDSLYYALFNSSFRQWTGFKYTNSIELVYTFYRRIRYDNGFMFYSANGGDRRMSIYSDFFNTNSGAGGYTTPADMTHPGDTVAWYNLKYIYNKRK